MFYFQKLNIFFPTIFSNRPRCTDFPEFSGFHQEVVKISGDSSLAVVHATFGVDFVVEGQTLSGEGKVLATASKAEGDWLFSSVCFNWNAPPAPTQ